DRQAISRGEIDRLAQLEQGRHRALEARHTGVRNGDAATKTGAAKPLTLFQLLEHFGRVEAPSARKSHAERFEHSLFVSRIDDRDRFRLHRKEWAHISDLTHSGRNSGPHIWSQCRSTGAFRIW